MAKRKRKAINGWMLRQRGIFRRWAKATVKTKTGVNYVQMPEQYTAKRPPRPDRRGTVMHEVPPSKRQSIEKTAVEGKRIEVEIKEEWTSYRHSGLTHFNYKTLESRGRPPWWEMRVYFHGSEVLFLELVQGEVGRITEIYSNLESALKLYKKWGKDGLRWKQE